MNSAESVRPAFTHLTAIAQKHNCAIILVGHFNKSKGNAQYRGLGSIDIVNSVPSVMYVGYIDRENGIRAIVHGKSNYSEAGISQVFSLSKEDGFQ